MAQVQDIPTAGATKKGADVMAPNVLCERNIRRFVKPNGNFRKGETPENIAACRELFAEWDKDHAEKGATPRDENAGWNMGIVVPGMEKITASPKHVRPNALQETAIINLQDQVTGLVEMNKKLMAQLGLLAGQAASLPGACAAEGPNLLDMTVAQVEAYAKSKMISFDGIIKKGEKPTKGELVAHIEFSLGGGGGQA